MHLISHFCLDDIVSRSLTAEVLTATTTRPSFLVWDKVYQKLSEAEDTLWLLRAADLAVPTLASELAKHAHQR